MASRDLCSSVLYSTPGMKAGSARRASSRAWPSERGRAGSSCSVIAATEEPCSACQARVSRVVIRLSRELVPLLCRSATTQFGSLTARRQPGSRTSTMNPT